MAKKIKVGKATEIKCAFCSGTGKDPFGLLSPLSICQVCLGRGKVKIIPPTAKCAFCDGTGIYPDKRLTCTVCGGKGVVTMPKDAKLCTICNGTGQAPDGLPCLNCHGKGVV
ncbi:MAG: hypothetical protein FP833_05080 [Atribacteria sp.]|nr:hypothetical protein [Candidatus Atribacteria bacterium]MBU4228170.1 hypothetical protein [bacterium]